MRPPRTIPPRIALLALAGVVASLVIGLGLWKGPRAWRSEPVVPLAISTQKQTPPVEDLARLEGGEEQQAPAPAPEAFDRTPVNSLPAGWSRWTNDPTASIGVTATRALTTPHALGITGSTNAAARAWLATPLPADVQATAAFYLDTLIPQQVLVRGSNLNTTSPSCYAVAVARGVELQLVRVSRGTTSTLARLRSATYLSQRWVRVTLSAQGNTLRVRLFRTDTEHYLSAAGQWQPAPAWAVTVTNTDLPAGGQCGLGRTSSFSGTILFDDFAVTPPEAGGAAAPPPVVADPPVVVPPGGTPLPRPNIPRHYPHIRVAALAYAGTPFGAYEEQLLRDSIDLVIPNVNYLDRIHRVAPATPKLIYTNTSNLYQELLTDWLEYADRRGIPREGAFYHAARPTPFRGDSPSSRAVARFWSVYRGGRSLTNVTSAAHGTGGRITFGTAGESVYLGYPERFREINVTLASGAAGGWSGALEYVTAVDAAGAPTGWAPLTPLTETTAGLTRSGQTTFDPPANWKPASINHSARLYYVRIRTTALGGTPPVATALLGRDYVEANGRTSGTVPVFDPLADADRDGYLNDAEYERRAAGKDARFLYESRVFTESYGQMRPATNPSNPAFRAWAVDFHGRLAAKHPLATGFFMDNAGGKSPVQAGAALEPVDNYGTDSGVLLREIWRAAAPRWVLANTGGAGTRAEAVVQQNPAYFEEFGIRPLSHNWAFFEELAALVARRAALSAPAPLAVLDSHPQRGTITDARMQLGVLAYYYLLADPETTFLVFHGGVEPASSWTRHWSPAAAYNIGRPTSRWSQRDTGPDPANPALSYRLYQRTYERALVLHKPLSHARGVVTTAAQGDDTATRHDLGGSFQPLRADGTLGPAITSISLRNGEGAILIRTQP